MKKKELEKQVKILTGIVIALGIHEIVKHQKRKAKKHLMKKMLMRQFIEHSKDRHSCHCHEHDHHCHDHHNKKWMLPLMLAIGTALYKDFAKNGKHHLEGLADKCGVQDMLKHFFETCKEQKECGCHHHHPRKHW